MTDAPADPVLEQAACHVENGHAAEALALIMAGADDAPSRFNALARLHYRRGEIDAMIACGIAGIERLSAAGAPGRKAAKSLAYNVAANCWPGWGDPVSLSVPQIEAGLDLAEASRTLVAALGLGPAQVGNAHWLVGALLLALGRRQQAIEAFAAAEQIFEEQPEILMARGYGAIALGTDAATRDDGRRGLAEVRAALAELTGDEPGFYSAQLATAAEIFAGF